LWAKRATGLEITECGEIFLKVGKLKATTPFGFIEEERIVVEVKGPDHL
jgi:hypothetical protein